MVRVMPAPPPEAAPPGGLVPAQARRRRVREDLTAAAIRLFLANGYDATTADDIAEAAGVARRTFFRHFRTKEDAVFPDHEVCLARVRHHLASAGPDESPLAVLGAAAHLVLARYTEDPQTAVHRYRIVREVESLREREITTTSRYQRVFSDYLNRRFGGDDQRRLVHEMAAAAIVAAHNFVLRQWLRDGGNGDAHTRLDAALRAIADSCPGWLGAAGAPAAADRPDSADVLVLRVRPDTPLWRIAEEIEAAAAAARR